MNGKLLSTDTWSISMAIMFTFYEKLPHVDNCVYECLAITKLSTMIQEQWNRDQVFNFSSNLYINSTKE